MNATSLPSARVRSETPRLDYLDATRAFALILGIVFHAMLSFMPVFIGWAVQDVSTTRFALVFFTVSHAFRMETFFLIAGFFGHMSFHRKGAGEFIRSRAMRIVVPFVVGWFMIKPLIASGWVMGAASMRGHYSFSAGLAEGFRSLSQLPTGIFTQTHLWFLYYLALITVVTLFLRAMIAARASWHDAVAKRADAAVGWIARSRAGFVVLVVPTFALLSAMRMWGVDTPDLTLVPNIPVLALYSGCFILGWLLHRQPTVLGEFARLTVGRAVVAALAAAATLALHHYQMDPGNPHYHAAHVASNAAYAVLMWTLVALTIGAFRRLCSKPRAWVRYLADSSYWLYLAHLPIVVWLQVAVGDLPLHWSIKLAGIVFLTLAACLLTYDVFVRPTIIGQVLNGTRREGMLAKWLRQSLRRRAPAAATIG